MRSVLSFLISVACAATVVGPANAQQSKPNVLVIISDDVEITNISAHSRGFVGYQTLNIDRIAAPAKAVSHFRKAALEGNAPGQALPGCAYFDRHGIVRDASKAVAWLHKSAHQTFADARAYLGTVYRSGKDVKQSYAEASKWFVGAGAQGNYPAKQAVVIEEQRSSPYQEEKSKHAAKQIRADQ